VDVTFPLPSWVTVILVLCIYILILYRKGRASGAGLTQHDFLVAVVEAIPAGNVLVLCINVFYLVVVCGLRLPSGLLEAPDPILSVALSLLALLLIFFVMGGKRAVETREVVK
jgi:hypothetical protein